jgi:osmoprotectant transport system permease protein
VRLLPALGQVPFPDWAWLTNPRTHERLVELAIQHVQLTLAGVGIGFAVAAPLAVVAVRRQWLYQPLLGATGVLYTIPSLAMFLFLAALYGVFLEFRVAVTGLALYSLLILFRNTAEGLRAVPAETREAAEALGHTRRQLLWRVELPVALPVIVAGLRIATVTTVGLVTITALIGWGGFGQLFIAGANRNNVTVVLTGVLASTLLAVLLDLALVATQRRLTPWAERT